METFSERVNELTARVLSKGKYRYVHPGLIRSLAESEFKKNQGMKDTIKLVTSKLHQIGGAYFPSKPNYANWISTLGSLPTAQKSPEIKSFCRQIMAKHHSTRERLPILETFFHETLASISPVRSILDLACGFNPLALPWMPIAEDFQYKGCDIFSDMVDFLTVFSSHFSMDAEFSTCNLIDCNFSGQYQVAFLLKTIPCLEQLESDFGSKLLEAIPADFLLISFPVRSLSGRGKGMRESYANRLEQILSRQDWPVQTFEFSDELAYLVKKQ